MSPFFISRRTLKAVKARAKAAERKRIMRDLSDDVYKWVSNSADKDLNAFIQQRFMHQLAIINQDHKDNY